MELPRRPAQGNTVGKPVKIGVNSYNITKFPDKTIYQYDVSEDFRLFCRCPIQLASTMWGNNGPTPAPKRRTSALARSTVLDSPLMLFALARFTLEMAPRGAPSFERSGNPKLFSKPRAPAGFLMATDLLGMSWTTCMTVLAGLTLTISQGHGE